MPPDTLIPAIITALLGISTALIAYVGVIQKEREFSRARPLLGVEAGEGPHGFEYRITNHGDEPALGIVASAAKIETRRDVLAPGRTIVLVVHAGAPELVIKYRGRTGPARRAIRRFTRSEKEFVYAGGSDQALGGLHRGSSPR